MRPIHLAMSAVVALAMAVPAAGQVRGGYNYGYNHDADTRFDLRIEQLENRIEAGTRAGTINRREAWRLRNQLSQIDRLEDRYARGGFSVAERRDLQQRIRNLRQNVRVADRGSWDRYERYGYWGDEDRYLGRGGPIGETACVDRRGFAGLIDDLTGRETCFSVGQRFTGGLYALPNTYRMRYRARPGVYYRTDGRNIIAIDARTHVILDIDPM